MAIAFSEGVRVPEGVIMRGLGAEAVVLHLESQTYFGLDEIAARMWVVLTGSPSIEAACAALRTEFEVEPAVLRADLEALVAELVGKGLLEPAR
jgi:hypothetical protein